MDSIKSAERLLESTREERKANIDRIKEKQKNIKSAGIQPTNYNVQDIIAEVKKELNLSDFNKPIIKTISKIEWMIIILMQIIISSILYMVFTIA